MLALGAGILAFVLAAPIVGAGAHPGDSAVDGDHDGVRNDLDNCPDTPNADQRDTDGDGVGDACDPDDDGDGVGDDTDNCPIKSNPTQADLDADGRGDTCDPDVDGDGFSNGTDNCPRSANPAQEDADADGIGDACDSTPNRPGGSDTTGGTGEAPTGDGGSTGGGGGTGGGGALTGTDPGDRSPPRATIVTAGLHELGALAFGLPIPVTCSETCAVSGLLELDGSAAKRLRLGKGKEPVPIASGAARLASSGRTFVILKFNKTALRRLASVRATRPRLRVIVADAADNRKILYRRLALKR
jgi:hypothetical protein